MFGLTLLVLGSIRGAFGCNGEIKVKSEPGRGSLFTIELPAKVEV